MAKGQRLVLDDEAAHIQHSATGRGAKLYEKGNGFARRVRIMSAASKQQYDAQRDVGGLHGLRFTSVDATEGDPRQSRKCREASEADGIVSCGVAREP